MSAEVFSVDSKQEGVTDISVQYVVYLFFIDKVRAGESAHIGRIPKEPPTICTKIPIVHILGF